GKAPFVLAPAACALLAAVADDGVPVTVGFGLVGGRDLKRERFAVLERGPAVEPDAGNTKHREIDRQYLSFLPGRKISGREVHGANGRVRKGLGIEAGRFLGVAVVPDADRILRLL